MSDPDHISAREYLAQYPQISATIFQMLSVAQAGGLEEMRANAMYHEILDAFSTLDGAAYWPFRDELIRLLVTPDAQFPDKGDADGFTPSGRN